MGIPLIIRNLSSIIEAIWIESFIFFPCYNNRREKQFNVGTAIYKMLSSYVSNASTSPTERNQSQGASWSAPHTHSSAASPALLLALHPPWHTGFPVFRPIHAPGRTHFCKTPVTRILLVFAQIIASYWGLLWPVHLNLEVSSMPIPPPLFFFFYQNAKSFLTFLPVLI